MLLLGGRLLMLFVFLLLFVFFRLRSRAWMVMMFMMVFFLFLFLFWVSWGLWVSSCLKWVMRMQSWICSCRRSRSSNSLQNCSLLLFDLILESLIQLIHVTILIVCYLVRYRIVTIRIYSKRSLLCNFLSKWIVSICKMLGHDTMRHLIQFLVEYFCIFEEPAWLKSQCTLRRNRKLLTHSELVSTRYASNLTNSTRTP